MAYIYVEIGTDGNRSFVEGIRVSIDFIHTINAIKLYLSGQKKIENNFN